jgi:hypothetical protein
LRPSLGQMHAIAHDHFPTAIEQWKATPTS